MNKEKVNVFDYANHITKEIKKGVLLNTNGEKFNAMVIGWGHLGVIWGKDTFTVYVRQSRFSKLQLDHTREFTVSVALQEKRDPKIFEVCGTMSGADVNKADYVTLVEPSVNHTPGVMEYPLTIECEVIYQQDMDLDKVDQELLDHYYGKGSDVNNFHTLYIGKIVDAYIIRP